MLLNMQLKEEVLNQLKRRKINHGTATIGNQIFNSTFGRYEEKEILSF